MYPAPFRYHRPASLKEATDMLAAIGDGAKPMSGGQSLIPLLKLRLDEPTDIVDIGRLPDLRYAEQKDGVVRIGALSTHGWIAGTGIATDIPIIRDVAGGIADPQVRARGTIGGGLCAADPNSDWPCLLHIMNAEAVCSGPGGQRTIPVQEFILDAYTTQLGRGELVTGVRIPAPPANSGGAYMAYKSAAPAYPVVSIGLQLTLADADTCRDVRIVFGGAGPKPRVASEAEEFLRAKVLSPEHLAQAADAVHDAAAPASDVRGTAEHKKQLLRGLFLRVAATAARRCRHEKIEGSHQYA